MSEAITVDALIVGGGIAGLWTLNRLQAAGYSALLLEAGQLGKGQTLASQGMIHGGLKYALRGQLTGASEAIAKMPERWRACLRGAADDVDLRGLQPLSERYYLFAQASTLGRLTTFFASKSLRGRIDKLSRDDYPEVFLHPEFNGVVYALNDFVLDTEALLAQLLANSASSSYRFRVDASALQVEEDQVSLNVGKTQLRARRLILAAGAGTEKLLTELGISEPRMQRRPLHQVVVRHRHQAPMFAHCLTAVRRAEPRLTITSHADGDHWLWYLGGQLATTGVDRQRDAQIAFARDELAACVPWMDWQQAQFDTLWIDRAEPAQEDGQRPDEAFVHAAGPVIVGWPTKLSLVPDLGDQMLTAMPPPAALAPTPSLDLPAASVAQPPWQAQT
ncbi:MAG: NAD(P)/FAD-dependent oxidoreductase [Pseudomonadales bacterium]